MEGIGHSGEFCPNPECQDYGKLQKEQPVANLKKIGFTRGGVQRYQCKSCRKTFTATHGTIFFHKKTSEERILEILALLAEGSRISSLTRVSGIKEDTILAWLRAAAAHAEQIEDVLMGEYQIQRGQLDALWGYVGRKKTHVG